MSTPAHAPRPSTSADGATTAWPDVSVIVPAHDGAGDLARCLTALAAQDYAGEVQIIVVDNDSREDLGAVVEVHSGVLLLHEARRGSYAARNTGLSRATGEVLAFTDADCSPHVDWLTEAVIALTRPTRVDMVGGGVEMTYRHGRPITASELYEHVHGFPQERYLADQHFAVTANMITWRAVVDRVGEFDASLQSRGDAQWGQRVAAVGGSQRYAPAAVVRHPARETLKESVTKWRRVARGRVQNDLASRRSTRHFVGLVANQFLLWAKAVPSARRAPELQGMQQLRYLGAVSLCRIITIATFAAPLAARPSAPHRSSEVAP